MKQILSIVAFAMAISFANAQSLTTPQPSPTQTLKQNFGVGNIELSYSRPAKKGRKVMGDLVPFGKVWRTGANGATTLTFSDDVSIGGKDIKAGKYGLLAIPNADKWTIIITKDVTINNPANYKIENDIVRLEAPVVALPFSVENFTINFDDLKGASCNVQMMWENTMVQFSIAAPTETKVMAQIDNLMNKDNRPYFAAASYYFDNGKDVKQALTWVNKAIETNQEAYWMYLLKAKIQKQLGDKVNAKTTAAKVVELATKAKNDDYVKMGNELMAGL